PDGRATASRSRDTSALTTLLLFRGKAAVRTAAVETIESDELRQLGRPGIRLLHPRRAEV
ncbi:MAG TPA: hypothetical protein VFE45_08170, partial [Coriobacteriia bacterium]|nr:hypothetical protein [Coriobacteriia bacterium]